MRYKVNENKRNSGLEELAKEKVNASEEKMNGIMSRTKERINIYGSYTAGVDGEKESANVYFEKTIRETKEFLNEIIQPYVDMTNYNRMLDRIAEDLKDEIKKYKPKKDKIK